MKSKYLLMIMIISGLAWPMAGFAAEVGEAAPDFVLKKTDGVEIRSDAIKGENPLMMVFWATWCPNCKEEIPKLKEIYAAFKPRGLDLLAVNVGVNDSLERTNRYMKKYDIAYPVSFDEGSAVTRRFKILGTPTVIIIDKSGVVRYRASRVPDDLEQHFEMRMN